jgi:predicted amidophosphoribosyltransferase
MIAMSVGRRAGQLAAWGAGGRALVDLVLPAACAGCGADGTAWCDRCADELASRAIAPAAPVPRPPGLPAVTAAGQYDGPLREAVVAYKDHGRHPLAAALGDRLAAAVRAAVGPGPALLVPVPATAAAARRRYGDHMARLARRAAATLRRQGVPAAVAFPLRARRRPDFAGLSAAQRRYAAGHSFAIRPRRLSAVRAAVAAGLRPVLVDDVMTTGATLTAAAELLHSAGVPIQEAAVLAATLSHRRDLFSSSHLSRSQGRSVSDTETTFPTRGDCRVDSG